MWHCRALAILGSMLITAGLAFAEDGPSLGTFLPVQDTKTSKPTEARPKVAVAPQAKTQPGKSLDSLQEALERQTREINALKEQYARDMQQQRKRAELQQQQIEILQRTAELLTDQVRKQGGQASSGEAIEKLQASLIVEVG